MPNVATLYAAVSNISKPNANQILPPSNAAKQAAYRFVMRLPNVAHLCPGPHLGAYDVPLLITAGRGAVFPNKFTVAASWLANQLERVAGCDMALRKAVCSPVSPKQIGLSASQVKLAASLCLAGCLLAVF